MTVTTVTLLAGAYVSLRVVLTHSQAEGEEATLCRRVKADSICDYNPKPDAPPTCKACLKKDPRFK